MSILSAARAVGRGMVAFLAAPVSLPAGERVYAVGDVHGCLGRLRALHRLIASDIADRPAASVTLVHLGDYVDGGPDSAGVLDLLCNGAPPAGVSRVVNLQGNHELIMTETLARRTPALARLWLKNGAKTTLRSFGVDDTDDPAAWAARIPAELIEFLRQAPFTYRAGGYFFVHAGVRPGVPLAAQKTEDMLWIGEPFLVSDAAFGALVVHGHTPVAAPVLRPNRVGVDTGAVTGGHLTCAILEADRVGFIQV